MTSIVGLQWNQISFDRIDVSWSVSKAPKSQFAALYNSSGRRVATLSMGGEERVVRVTLSQVGTRFMVTITATYYDNTSETGSVEICRFF